MKVILVADILKRDFDGCNRTLFQLLDRGINSQNIFYFCVAGVFENFPKSIPYTKVPHLTLPFNKDYQIALPYFIDNKVKKIFDEFQPDIVHITTPSLLGRYMQKEAIKRGLPVSTIYHTNFVSYADYYVSTKYLITKAVYNYLVGKYVKFYNDCNLILCPTRSMQNHLKEIGVKEDLLELMARGVNREIFYYKNEKSDQFKRFFQNKNKNILFASRLVWEKNLRVIIDIYNYCVQNNCPYNFIVVGDGVAYNTMKAEMPKAHFVGSVDQMRLCEIYNDADLFLFPSVTETFGNVVLEAMTCGLPVVAADGGSNPDVVENGKNGILVEEKNIHAYIEAFGFILQEDNYVIFRDEALNNRMSKSWDEINAEFIDKLNNLQAVHQLNIAHH